MNNVNLFLLCTSIENNLSFKFLIGNEKTGSALGERYKLKKGLDIWNQIN